jgi:hypothetical protein
MGSPVLTAYPTSEDEAVLDAIASILADDPVLGSAGVVGPNGLTCTLYLDDGDPEQFDPPPESRLPCVAMVPGDFPAAQFCENAHKGDLTVFFDCYSPGVHRTDARRLTTAVRRALRPEADARAVVVDRRYADAVDAAHGGKLINVRFSRIASGRVPYAEGRWGLKTRLAAVFTLIVPTL